VVFTFLLGSTNSIGGWSFDSSYLWAGTKQTSDNFSSSGVTLKSDGSFYSPTFWVNESGGMGLRTNNGTGQRIEMSSTDNNLVMYDSQGRESVTIDSGSTAGHGQVESYYYSGTSTTYAVKAYQGGEDIGLLYGSDIGKRIRFYINSSGVTYIIATNLPTSSSGLPSGYMYIENGFVKIIP
jgi:hypothetical protein